MAKYTPRLVNKIVSLIEADTYTISEICETLRISRNSFYEWKRERPEFAAMIDDAIERRDEMLLLKARRSLMEKLDGYTVREVKVTYEPDKYDTEQMKIKSKVIKTKECPPDMATIRLVLERNDRKKASAQRESIEETQPAVIIVQDEETKTNLEILRLNGGEPGGALIYKKEGDMIVKRKEGEKCTTL